MREKKSKKKVEKKIKKFSLSYNFFHNFDKELSVVYEMSVCKSNLTIKCDTSNILHELLESFYSYTNEQFEIKDISGNILKCVFVTSWYPDFELMEELIRVYGCWLKNEWREDGGMQGVWVGYKDNVVHIKKIEWLDQSV